MRAVVLLPWRDGDDDRRRQLYDWSRPFLEELGWPIYEGAGPLTGPFCRSAAVNEAARAAGEWDVALIGDADTVQQVAPAHRAADRVLAGEGLVVPWTHRIKLSRESTEKFAMRGPNSVTDWDRDERDRTRPWGGGATVVVSRDAWETVGGFDEGFVGYGNEDLGFKLAVEVLYRGGYGAEHEAGLVWHLWHQPAPNVGSKSAATEGNRKRWFEYRRLKNDTEAFREYVMGGRP